VKPPIVALTSIKHDKAGHSFHKLHTTRVLQHLKNFIPQKMVKAAADNKEA
jgi:hypothetical protein